MATGVEWADEMLNILYGCSPVSAGCAQCYAARDSHIHGANPGPSGKYFRDLTVRQSNGVVGWSGKVNYFPEKLVQPFRWKRPRRIFLNGFSDTFHKDVYFQVIDEMFAMMYLAHWHTFQVLTKRPERMAVNGGSRRAEALRKGHDQARLTALYRVGKKAAGRTLDGVQHDGFPDVGGKGAQP